MVFAASLAKPWCAAATAHLGGSINTGVVNAPSAFTSKLRSLLSAHSGAREGGQSSAPKSSEIFRPINPNINPTSLVQDSDSMCVDFAPVRASTNVASSGVFSFVSARIPRIFLYRPIDPTPKV